MDEIDHWWVGIGETPREAVIDLTPDTEQPGIAWVEGIYSVPDRFISREKSITADITVIYDSRPPKRWNVAVTFEDAHWHAYFVGGKRI